MTAITFMVQEWIQSKIATGDKYDYGDFLTVDTLETAINVFEKQTGFGDIINMVSSTFLPRN